MARCCKCNDKEQKPEEESPSTKESQLQYRDVVKESDIEAVREIIKSSNFFNQEEIDMAVELVQDRVEKGEKSTYQFLFVEQDNKTVAYSCYGRIAGTYASYDLYWMGVENQLRGQGIGKEMLKRTEEAIKNAGGYKIYIETASQEKYAPTRHFYIISNYILEGCLKDFYGPSDDKHIYTKVVGEK